MANKPVCWAAFAVIIGSTGVACVMPDQSNSKVIATNGVPSVSAAPTPQAAALGATIEVTTDLGTKATYTVSRFQPVTANEYYPVKGQLYAVAVTIQGEAGSVPVNPTYFSASTEDGTHVDSVTGVANNELSASELPPGQHVSGWVTFDVPAGKNITQILLSGPLGAQQAVWSVPSPQAGEQLPSSPSSEQSSP